MLLAIVSIAWSGALDGPARAQTEEALERALISYALARTMNGVISVAQGTEIAVQPAGVGVVLTAGQILDPLNDLIERFSWIVMLAATSLALQLMLGELATTVTLNAATTLLTLLCIALIWNPGRGAQTFRRTVYRATAVLLALRFALVATGFTMGALGNSYLDEREQNAVDMLADTSANLQTDTAGQTQPGSERQGLFDQLDEFIATQRENLNIEQRLERLERQIEAAIGEVLNLIVVYLLKTIVVPVAVLATLWSCVRYRWGANRAAT